MTQADQNGIEQVSMRSIAKALGVEAMSLYKHIPNKEGILDGLADYVVLLIAIPKETSNPLEALKELFTNKRKVYRKHPWAPGILETRLNFSHVRFQFMEDQFQLIGKCGYSLMESYRLLLALESFVYGFHIQESSWNFDSLPQKTTDGFAMFFPSHKREEILVQYPTFCSFLDLFFENFQSKKIETMMDTEFQMGLDRILGEKKMGKGR